MNFPINRDVQNFLEVDNNNVGSNVLDLDQEIRLRDGLMLRLRSLRIVDRERLRAFFARCSEEAIRYRFMSSIKAPSDSLLDYLSNVDGFQQVALVVTRGLGASEAILAEGRYAVFPY